MRSELAGQAAELMRGTLHHLGMQWFETPLRPRASPEAELHWQRLIEAWIDSDLPLPVRKASLGRGCAILHASGRTLTPTDNTIASWVWDCVLTGHAPTLDEVRGLFEASRMPLAMVMKSAEKADAVYARRGLRTALRPNGLGWKICHIDAVGFGGASSVDAIAYGEIVAHVRKLLSPANMFLIPLSYGGVGEVQAFIDGFQAARWQKGKCDALDR